MGCIVFIDQGIPSELLAAQSPNVEISAEERESGGKKIGICWTFKRTHKYVAMRASSCAKHIKRWTVCIGACYNET